jgi:hypothetical protein
MAGEMDLARIVNFDSFRAYRWLVTIAEPNAKLYDYLRFNGVELHQVINLLHGAIARCQWSLGRPKEDCIAIPVMGDDGVTPLDVVMFSMREPSRFGTMLGLGAVLGAGEVLNPATIGMPNPAAFFKRRWNGCRRGLRAAPSSSIHCAPNRSSTGRQAISPPWMSIMLIIS